MPLLAQWHPAFLSLYVRSYLLSPLWILMMFCVVLIALYRRPAGPLPAPFHA